MKTVARAPSRCLALALLAACRAPHVIDPTGPMQATCDDPDAITCADGWLPIRPYVAAPGRIRILTETTPRGVALPASLAGANAFFIVDVTPTDRTLFAVGVCPLGSDERGEPVVLGQRADGWVHVACIDSVLGGEPGHEERWRPLRFDVYEGIVSPRGGVIDWKAPVALPNVANDRHADRLEVRALTVTSGASVLTYELEAKGPKSYQTIATVNATLDPHGGAPTIDVVPVVPASDSSLTQVISSTVPTSLALTVDDWAVATIRSNATSSTGATGRSGGAALARWQLPRSSPEHAIATCDATGCAASFVFESGGTSAIVVKQRHRR